ncbi:hypothetical protein CR513_41423, partial [Mucuna pruriens]
MCDVSNSTLGAVLGQRAGAGLPVYVIAYASRTMDPAQQNYTTLRRNCWQLYLLKKPDAKSRLIQWMLLLQEFNIKIKDMKGSEEKANQCLSKMNSKMSSCYTPKRLHHGLPTSVIMWQHLSFYRRHLSFTKKNSRVMPNTTCGMILTYGDFAVTKSFAVELKDEHTNNTFQVNEHKIKLFHEGPVPPTGDMETISLMEPAPPDDTP